MQIYQNHVVFQSFSDLYTLEQRQVERQQILAAKKQAVVAQAKAAPSRSSSSSSIDSSPASSRAPSLLFHDLARSESNASSAATSTHHDEDVTAPQYYPAGLYSSKAERRSREKEADVTTLADTDMPVLQAAGAADLSLRRF